MIPYSERLEYQPLTETDWSFFLALNQDPLVVRYVADERSEDAIRHAFDVRLPRWEPGSPHWLCLVMREKASGQPVGVTGLIDRSDGVAEVGFLLASGFHRQGLGSESLLALCRAAFADAGYRKLTATVTAGNVASKVVLERAGFVQEGTLRESYFLAGSWQDDWLFGLLKRELAWR